MKKPLIVLALTAVGMVVAPGARAQTTGQDSVTGTASQCVAFFEPAPGQVFCERELVIDIDATSDAAGGSPSGSVTLDDDGLTPGGSTRTTAHVTCLAVSANVAIVGVAGELTQEGFPPPPGAFAIAGLFRIVDGGGPDSGADTIERAIQTGAISEPPLPGPTDCSRFPGPFPRSASRFPDFVNASGNLVVVDSPALPTTQAQCKNGGWRNFPGFKNQGDCVSYVATRGRNQPPGT